MTLAETHCASQPSVMDANAAGALQAQAVQIVRELAIVAFPRSAQDQVRDDRGRALSMIRIATGARRKQQRHRRRLHSRHLLGEKRQAIGKSVLKIAFSQLGLLRNSCRGIIGQAGVDTSTSALVDSGRLPASCRNFYRILDKIGGLATPALESSREKVGEKNRHRSRLLALRPLPLWPF